MGAGEELVSLGTHGSVKVMLNAFENERIHLDMDPAAPECRICQEEEDPSKLEAPCACSGSLKYAHRTCIQRWCDEKGDVMCEICLEPYKHGYTVCSSGQQSGSISIDISDDWGIPNAHPMGLRDPRILALAVAQGQLLESDYEEYALDHSGSAVCCRTVALILVTLLLLRHTITMTTSPADSDASMFLVVFVLRIVGFFVPCYIMVRGLSTLHREQPQGNLLTAAELSILLQAGHSEGIRIALAPVVDLRAVT